MSTTVEIAPEDLQKRLIEAATLIKNADGILLTSGAGLGVDSGLPDFRGPEGFWRNYPPMEKLKLRFEQMSTPSWFEKDPRFAWGFWGHRIDLYTNSTPHNGYFIMKKWAENTSNKKGYFVFTSNVDGHWRKASIPEKQLIECHGSVDFMQCCTPCTKDIFKTKDLIPTSLIVDKETFRAEEPLPQCPKCSKLARPNVLMFGDWGFIGDREREQDANFKDWKKTLKPDSKLVVIEVGAGKAVPTVRFTSENFCEKYSASLIRINLREADIPKGIGSQNVEIPLGGLDALTRIDNIINGAQ